MDLHYAEIIELAERIAIYPVALSRIDRALNYAASRAGGCFAESITPAGDGG